MAARQINVIVPICSMQQYPLVFVDPWNCWPLPVVQDTRRIDKDVAMIIYNLAALKVLDLHVVSALPLVPYSARDLMPCLDIFVQAVFTCKVVEISKNLF
jgi:hypothetical protein